MKGMIYRVQVCDSITDWTHGNMYTIHRLVIPEEGNLAVNLTNDFLGRFTVISGYEVDDGHEPVKEVEVPDDLVAATRTYLETRQRLIDGYTQVIPSAEAKVPSDGSDEE